MQRGSVRVCDMSTDMINQRGRSVPISLKATKNNLSAEAVMDSNKYAAVGVGCVVWAPSAFVGDRKPSVSNVEGIVEVGACGGKLAGFATNGGSLGGEGMGTSENQIGSYWLMLNAALRGCGIGAWELFM